MKPYFKLIKVTGAILLISLIIIFLLRGRDYTDETLKLDIAVQGLLERNRISESELLYESTEKQKKGRRSFLKVVRRYEVGSGFQRDNFSKDIKELLKDLKFSFAESTFEREDRGEKFTLSFSFKDKILYELSFFKSEYDFLRPYKTSGGKIALVLDDFGYNMNSLDLLFGVTMSLTVSVLPNLPYSTSIAEELRRRNFEVILHLPLEPHGEAASLEKGTIMVDMPREEVNALLAKAIRSVPGSKGISNHMGSKATEDRAFMKNLFEELKKRGLYFLDNLVTNKSVCKEVAKNVGLNLAARSVFLDNESNESYIEKQLLLTAEEAARTGWALGVGHDRPNTIKVLARVLPRLEKAGFEFVYVSDLLR